MYYDMTDIEHKEIEEICLTSEVKRDKKNISIFYINKHTINTHKVWMTFLE